MEIEAQVERVRSAYEAVHAPLWRMIGDQLELSGGEKDRNLLERL